MNGPAWLTAAIDQRIALMSEALQLSQMQGINIMMTPLTEPPEGATDAEYKRWDQSCDNCGKHVPSKLYSGHVTRDVGLVQVIIAFGMCAECKDLP